jgi:hypothetical protein
MTREDCNDVVSRAELLKIYEDRFVELQKIKHLKDNKGANDRQLGVNYCINILKELPPVTPIQEPILGKIKAEIVEEMLSHSGTGEEVIQAYADGLKKGLAIIDKYKSESEDKE